jgi:hypothetical protein
MKTVVIANEVKQSSIVYNRSLQNKALNMTLASFCGSMVIKIWKIAASLRSSQ